MKQLMLFIGLLLFSYLSNAQLTVTAPTVAATPGQTLYLPVKLIGASSSGIPISTANVKITYDSSVLTYDTLTNFYSGTPQNQWFFSGNLSMVSANWVEPYLLTVPIPDSTTLFEMVFTYNGGTSQLPFITYEFTDALFNFIPTTPVNGLVYPFSVNRQVTFSVDLSEQQSISPDGVHLAGSFNNWNCSAIPMTTSGNDSVYTTTIELLDNQSHTYRFVNGNDSSGMEFVPAICGVLNAGGGYDREIFVPEHDTVLDLVCFGQCDTCGVIVTEIYITFRVDMATDVISPDGVHIAGSFQGWDPSATLMSPGPNNVYSITLPFDFEEYHEYRFINGITWENAEEVPAACANNDNRYLDVPDHDTILDIICFSDCGPCIVGIQGVASGRFSLDQNIPNPCLDFSEIGFRINAPAHIKLVVYNAQGIAVYILYDGYCETGSHKIMVDTREWRPGIYSYLIYYLGDVRTESISRKLIRE